MKGSEKRLSRFFSSLILIIMAVIVLYPLVFVLMTSLKTNEDVVLHPFIMTTFAPENYINAWITAKVGQYFLNSVIITFSTLALQLIIIIPGGYALGKLKFWGHKLVLTLYLATMMITSLMVIVPQFMMLQSWKLLGTRWSLLIPYVVGGLVLGIYLVSNYVKSIPKELDEAAIVDGAGVFKIMTAIDMPLILPVLSTIIILNFQGTWSDFFWALIVTSSYEKIKTLPMGLVNLSAQFNANYGILASALMILTIPVVMVYLFFSRYFIDGVASGAVKG